MKIEDSLWTDIWVKEKYLPISSILEDIEVSVCLASFAYTMKSNFREDMKILDYGCGPGRLCNFMSKRLKNFTYYGIEPKSIYGKSCIDKAKILYKNDKRANFGFIGEDIEIEAINSVDVVLLLSIFTHTTIEQTEIILKKLNPIIEKNGSIVFSVILDTNYKTVGSGAYTLEDTYQIVYNTEEQIEEIKRVLECNIKLEDTYLTPKNHLHSIYRAFK